jgi:hypothetical protein
VKSRGALSISLVSYEIGKREPACFFAHTFPGSTHQSMDNCKTPNSRKSSRVLTAGSQSARDVKTEQANDRADGMSKLGLLLPLVLSLSLTAISVYGALILGVTRQEMISIRDRLGLVLRQGAMAGSRRGHLTRAAGVVQRHSSVACAVLRRSSSARISRRSVSAAGRRRSPH